jgi:hypothetical protein
MQLYGTRSLDSGAFLRADYAVRAATCCVQHLFFNRRSAGDRVEQLSSLMHTDSDA